MNINDLEQAGVRLGYVNGKALGVTLAADCPLTDAEVWAVIDELGLRATAEDLPTQPLEPPPPDWGQFRLAMFKDTAYQQIAAEAAQSGSGLIALQRVESEIREQDTNLDILPLLWAQLLSMATPPTAQTIDRWNQYCADSFVPFEFGADGAINTL